MTFKLKKYMKFGWRQRFIMYSILAAYFNSAPWKSSYFFWYGESCCFEYFNIKTLSWESVRLFSFQYSACSYKKCIKYSYDKNKNVITARIYLQQIQFLSLFFNRDLNICWWWWIPLHHLSPPYITTQLLCNLTLKLVSIPGVRLCISINKQSIMLQYTHFFIRTSKSIKACQCS